MPIIGWFLGRFFLFLTPIQPSSIITTFVDSGVVFSISSFCILLFTRTLLELAIMCNSPFVKSILLVPFQVFKSDTTTQFLEAKDVFFERVLGMD